MPLIAQVQHDSPLGRWRIAQWAPSPALSGFVTMTWDLESQGAYTRERIPPRTHFDMLVNLGEPHRLLQADDAPPRVYKRAWIAGLQHEFLAIETPRFSRIMGVQLTAAGARGLLRAPLLELTGRVVELDEILGRDVTMLREQLSEGRSAGVRLGMLERWIEARLVDAPIQPPLVTEGMCAIRRSDGACRIRDLARDAGVSHKHLITLFERNVGLAPKQFAQVVRFNALLESLKHCKNVDWGDVVYRFGYFDHTHFARELRRFTGVSPTEFLRSRGPDGDTVLV